MNHQKTMQLRTSFFFVSPSWDRTSTTANANEATTPMWVNVHSLHHIGIECVQTTFVRSNTILKLTYSGILTELHQLQRSTPNSNFMVEYLITLTCE